MTGSSSWTIEIAGYRLTDRIGRGGFSSVYRAKDLRHDRDVAIKVLNLDQAGAPTREAFERECQTMGRLSQHPNIVTVFDSGFAKTGEPFIVMPLYSGGTCADLVARQGPMTPSDALTAGVEIASALTSAHRAGVIHRDIKPDNLFIDNYSRRVLGDFGIAAFAGNEAIAKTSDTGVAFTPAHAAPEVLRDEPPDELSDLYSLGSTLYTLLAGHSPFTADTVAETMVKALTERPPPIARADLPDDFEPLLGRLLAKDRRNRPSSAAEVVRELQSLQRGEGLPVTEYAMESDAARSAEESSDAQSPIPRRTLPPLAILSIVIAAAAIGLFVVWGFLDTGQGASVDPNPATPTSQPGVDTSESISRIPAPPATIVSRFVDTDTVEITWPASDVREAVWDVVRIDRDDRETQRVDEPLLEIGELDVGEIPCVEISTVFDGLVSAPSRPHCATP